MKYFSMFSGIGGFELGIQQAHLDWECVGYSEIDKYAIQVYNSHFNHVNYGDATIIKTADLPDFDLLVGGFPCQSFSIAGKRQGFNEARGTLFFEIARILRDKRPRYFVLENVKGLLSHDSGKTIQTIFRVLTDLGYSCEWQVLNSKNFGVPQNRERIFIIGYFRGERRSEVLPFGGVTNKTLDFLGGAETKKWLEDGKRLSRNYPQGNRIYSDKGISTTLASNQGGLGGKTGLYFIDLSTKQAKLTKEARTIQARYFKGYSHRAAEISGVAIAWSKSVGTHRGKTRNEQRVKVGEFNTLSTGIGGSNQSSANYVGQDYKIRRLTPIECERLQGFPDNWTQGISDTQRYKCLGNAVTVNVVKYIVSTLGT